MKRNIKTDALTGKQLRHHHYVGSKTNLGKFMKVRKVVIPTLTLIAIMASTTPGAYAMTPAEATDFLGEGQTVVMEIAEVDAVTAAAPIYTADGQKVVYAANPVSTQDKSIQGVTFNDLGGYDWARAAIEDLASRDIIKGIGDGKFAPANNVTRQEFAIMAIRAMGGDIESLAAQASEKAKTDSNYTSLDVINAHEDYQKDKWANSVICAIQNYADLDTAWGISKDEWSANATRADMAFIVMTIAEQSGKEQFAIKDGINNNIGDYNEVSRSPYANSILKAYSNGILVGTNSNGDYEPSGLSNRAQAAVVMQRVIDPSTRTPVEVKVPEVKPPVEGENIGSLTGTVYPTEGMVINGKTVTRDPNTGVLGFGNGQNGYVYNGIQIVKADGSVRTIAPGSIAGESYDNMTMGDTYTERHNFCYWDSEWDLIESYAYNKLPNASAQYVGQKGDINGNIIKDGSGTAFWECRYDSIGEFYQWYRI